MDEKYSKSHHHCTTIDGWRLHLLRVNLRDGSVRKLHPIVLVPGFGCSGTHTFDLLPGHSLAEYLAEREWDVWIVDLRGNGDSDKPQLIGSRSCHWTIDDNLHKDIPALLQYILQATGSTAVHMVGHSLGGMILCALLGQQTEMAQKVKTAVALSSGCFLEGRSWFIMRSPVAIMSKITPIIPARLITKAVKTMIHAQVSGTMLNEMYFWPDNIDPKVGQLLLHHAVSNVSTGVATQMMTAFNPTGLQSSDGKFLYADESALQSVTVPVLFMCGDRDRSLLPQAAKKTFDMFGSKDKTWQEVGPDGGYSEHYGHFDILVGKAAAVEIFPRIEKWLHSRDGQTPSSTDTNAL